MSAHAGSVRVGYKNDLPERMPARPRSRHDRQFARARKRQTRCYAGEVPSPKSRPSQALLGSGKDC